MDRPKGVPQHPFFLPALSRRKEAVTTPFASFGQPKEDILLLFC